MARISSVQARPSPATSSGWAAIARVSRCIAFRARRGLRGRWQFRHRARQPPSVIAKFGAEQPSTPQPATVSPVTSSVAARIAFCSGWSISTYSGPAFRCWSRSGSRNACPSSCCATGRAFVALISRSRSVAVIGFMRAAAQIGLARPRSASQRRPCRHAARALMAGAGQRQMRGRQPARSGGPGFDQRQRLHHLAGRAREDHRLRVAPGLRPPLGIADHRMAQMGAFQQPPRQSSAIGTAPS
jgi:hypothetical protein